MDDLSDVETQLAQLERLLAVAGEEDKAGILTLIQDLKSLLNSSAVQNIPEGVSPSSTPGPGAPASSSSSSSSLTDPDRDEEYLRFQEELQNLESESRNCEDVNRNPEVDKGEAESESNGVDLDSSNLDDELSALIGMKCKAPFVQNWGQVGFYNAFVSAVEPINLELGDQISVSVIFTQPLSERMRACPYFLSGTCRYDEGCKFSHVEVTPLSLLKDYTEPDFSTLATGSQVLAKYSDELWYRGVISRITESGECEVSYENYPEKVTIPLHDAVPLYDADDDGEGSEVNSSDSDSSSVVSESEESADPVPMAWVHMRGTSALGLWEQHTRGMGSKLMAKMGYVFGSGLGKNGEGRVEPVDAVILPPGRSLDTVMRLKEKAGGSTSNLFSAERHMKRLQRKKKERDAKLDSKIHQSQSMFNFLNDQLNLRKETSRLHQSGGSPIGPTTATHHKESSVSLSKQLLTVGERVRQVTRDIAKCREGVKRHSGRDQATVDAMSRRLTNLESHLAELKKSELKISNEQQHRNDKKKLTIF